MATGNRERGDRDPEAFYGLPATVAYCTRCTMSNQRPSSTVEFRNTNTKETLALDEEGVCSACRLHERKWNEIDYEARRKVLEGILDKHRRSDGGHDVIVPGSGGKDSAYVSHVLKYEYGMHPLTVTWPPHLYTDIGRQNFDNWVRHFDNVSLSPAGNAHRLLTREAFLNLLHPFQPFILGQKNIGPKLALKFGIKLIMFGESESEGGTNIDANNPVQDPRFFAAPEKDRTNVVIGGRTYDELLGMGLDRSELDPYLPVSLEAFRAANVDAYYMSYFENWRSQEKYYYAVDHCAFEPNPERTEGTFTKFCSLDDKIDGLQYYTTYIKFGIGRATYDSAQEIRHRYIDRDEGVALVHKYDGEFPRKHHQEILDYMGIDEETFWNAIDKARSPHLWDKQGNDWKPRHRVR